MANKENELALYSFVDNKADPEHVQALNILMTKKIPKSAVRERPGKGGQKWKYVDHIWLTKQLQTGMRAAWDFEVLRWEVFRETLTLKNGPAESRSVVALCSFTYHIPLKSRQPGDPLSISRKVTEVGVFEPNAAMPTAQAIASAVSRGLCRCVMRALGIGIELYGDDERPMTPTIAYETLKDYAEASGQKWTAEFEKEYKDALARNGIEGKDLVDEFDTAFALLTQMLLNI